ncbi:hypothetical protein XENOCAPTIV_008685 [Xenoophorus captivus]|uniref:Uncharacterized protein n=1 Tax=Xenoophorus captivus TaxID=1517983 RepID=A0ABV0QV19_9TELE
MQVYNHSQGRPSYGQSFQAPNTYQPSQNNSQQQQLQSQYVPGLGRGEANKNQKQGQQLWHRMKRKVFLYLPQSCLVISFLCCIHSSDWPQAMKEYVQRCFTACETEEDKDRTEKVLKEVLQERLKDGSAYTIDWTHEPLPELKVKQSRWEAVPPQRTSDHSMIRGGSTVGAVSRGRGIGHRLGNYRNIFSQRSPSSSSSQSSRSPSPSHSRHRDRSSQRHRRRYDPGLPFLFLGIFGGVLFAKR